MNKITQLQHNLFLKGQSRSFFLNVLEADAAENSQAKHSRLRGHEIASILMAARAINPQLLEPIQQHGNWQNLLPTDEVTPTRPFMARLLTLGIWFSEALGLAPPTREQQMVLAQEIQTLTEPKVSANPPTAIVSAQSPSTLSAASPLPDCAQELESQVDQSIKQAGQALLHKQDPLGFWQGDLTADTTLESDYILLLLWLYPPEANQWDPITQTKVKKAMSTILDRQLEDGGWNIYLEGPAEVNATTRAYVALRVGGYKPTHPIMQRARERILALGGLQATNSYTKNNLSMFGLFPSKIYSKRPSRTSPHPRKRLV